MKEKKKEILVDEVKEEKQAEKQPEKRQVFTTNEPQDPRKKSKITTRDLPAYLENYHGRKEKKNE